MSAAASTAVERPPGIAAAALLHALLWLHGAWSEALDVPLAPLQAWILVVIYNGAALFLYWRLAEWLIAARGYAAADRYFNLAAGLILCDTVIRSIALASGSDRLGSGVIPLFGPYSLIVGYQYLYYFALGTTLIALGYAVMRVPDDGPWLRGYGRGVLASGMCFAAFLGDLAIWPGVAADLMLAWRFGRTPPVAAPPPAPSPRAMGAAVPVLRESR